VFAAPAHCENPDLIILETAVVANERPSENQKRSKFKIRS
jgi:hypothetical protein